MPFLGKHCTLIYECVDMVTNDSNWNEISAIDPDSALEELISAIGELLDIGDYDTVIEETTEVIERDDMPHVLWARALTLRARAKTELGEAKSAIADFNEAALACEGDEEMLAFIMVHRSTAYGNQGSSDLEMADLNAVIEMEDVSPEMRGYALINRAVVREQAGDLAGSAADYETYFSNSELDPENESWARCNFGWLLYRQGDYEGTIEQTRLGLAIDPDIAFAHANIGLCLLRLGRDKEAIKQYKRTLKLVDSTEEIDDLILGDLKTLEAEAPDTPGLDKVLKLVDKRRTKLAKREG